jgi:xanthine dehydrogenase accessory factor
VAAAFTVPSRATRTKALSWVSVGNPCLSGGTLEIFLEAMLPPVLVGVYGESPVARALERLGTALDWDMRPGLDPVTADTSAVVVA